MNGIFNPSVHFRLFVLGGHLSSPGLHEGKGRPQSTVPLPGIHRKVFAKITPREPAEHRRGLCVPAGALVVNSDAPHFRVTTGLDLSTGAGSLSHGTQTIRRAPSNRMNGKL